MLLREMFWIWLAGTAKMGTCLRTRKRFDGCILPSLVWFMCVLSIPSTSDVLWSRGNCRERIHNCDAAINSGWLHDLSIKTHDDTDNVRVKFLRFVLRLDSFTVPLIPSTKPAVYLERLTLEGTVRNSCQPDIRRNVYTSSTCIYIRETWPFRFDPNITVKSRERIQEVSIL